MNLWMSSPRYGPITERIRFARAYAADQLPWFAPALYRCRIHVTTWVDVASIDLHYNVYWNPDVVDSIWKAHDRRTALSELAFLWVHEISHRLRRHGERAQELGIRGQAAARRWNVACDFEINDAHWQGLRMPAAYPGMLPQDFGLPTGQLAETYLRLMDAGEAADTFSIEEGSGIHGQPRPWETGDRQELSPVDEEIIRREVARRTREAELAQVSNGWREWAGEVLGSRVNWRQRLGHRLSVSLQRGIGSRTDYSFVRPNRRQSVYHPILPPSLGGGRAARVAIVVDTSGSMEPADLQRALIEVAAVVQQFDYPVTIIPCDQRAYRPVEVVSARQAFTLNYLPGGGGTDMAAGIRAALHLRPRPDCVLVVTDGETAYPAAPYAVPVIFTLLQRAGKTAPLPPNPPYRQDQVVIIRTDARSVT